MRTLHIKVSHAVLLLSLLLSAIGPRLALADSCTDRGCTMPSCTDADSVADISRTEHQMMADPFHEHVVIMNPNDGTVLVSATGTQYHVRYLSSLAIGINSCAVHMQVNFHAPIPEDLQTIVQDDLRQYTVFGYDAARAIYWQCSFSRFDADGEPDWPAIDIRGLYTRLNQIAFTKADGRYPTLSESYESLWREWATANGVLLECGPVQ